MTTQPHETSPGDAEGAADTGAPPSPEEERRKQKEEEARAAMRALKPWEGEATRQDKALLAAFIVIPAFFLALTPLKPLLIADHPVGLALVTGSNAAIGAASAFARIGELPLWLVLCVGVVGKIKIDWLFWWLGRRWGRGIVNLLTPSERARRFADKVRDANPWFVRTGLMLSYVPGVPSALFLVVAGWTGMRLRTFMLLDAIGALLITSVIAGAGYAAGQTGVDIVLTVDRYGLWFTIALIFAMAFAPVIRQRFRAKADERDRARSEDAAGAGGADTAADTAGADTADTADTRGGGSATGPAGATGTAGTAS
jgi:membrane protein DedA with SNARE-associated domain